MPKAIFYCAYKLKEGANVDEFLKASEKLNREHISKQNGYVSWQQLRDGDLWVDMCVFESMDDVKEFEAKSENPCQVALDFYSYINLNSCKVNHFVLEREYL